MIPIVMIHIDASGTDASFGMKILRRSRTEAKRPKSGSFPLMLLLPLEKKFCPFLPKKKFAPPKAQFQPLFTTRGQQAYWQLGWSDRFETILLSVESQGLT